MKINVICPECGERQKHIHLDVQNQFDYSLSSREGRIISSTYFISANCECGCSFKISYMKQW